MGEVVAVLEYKLGTPPGASCASAAQQAAPAVVLAEALELGQGQQQLRRRRRLGRAQLAGAAEASWRRLETTLALPQQPRGAAVALLLPRHPLAAAILQLSCLGPDWLGAKSRARQSPSAGAGAGNVESSKVVGENNDDDEEEEDGEEVVKGCRRPVAMLPGEASQPTGPVHRLADMLRLLDQSCGLAGVVVADDADRQLVEAALALGVPPDKAAAQSARVVLLASVLVEGIDADAAAATDATDTAAATEATDTAAATEAADSSMLSHIFFSSGSTGGPKAIGGNCGQLQAAARGLVRALELTVDSVCLVAAGPAFDPSLGGLLACLRQGATAVLPTPEALLLGMPALLGASGATHLLASPAHLHPHQGRQQTSDEPPQQLSRLRVVALGGEAMSAALISVWAAPLRRLVNLYGVTEACVYQACGERVAPLSSSAAPTPPLLTSSLDPGTRLLLVRSPVVPRRLGDDVGEVWIAGAMVVGATSPAATTQSSTGYLLPAHTPAATAATLQARYVTHPQFGRCFCTGDLARVHCRTDPSALAFELLGRRDWMVKLSGQLVQLEEVDSALQAILTHAPGIFNAAAATLVKADATSDTAGAAGAAADGSNRQVLVAVLEANPDFPLAPGDPTGAAPPPTNPPSEAELLRAHGEEQLLLRMLHLALAPRLPPIMRPAAVAVLPQLARLAGSMKLARRALSEHVELRRLGMATALAAQPRSLDTEWEVLVARVWSSELGVAVDDASADFGALSGDSLAAVRVVQRLHRSLGAADDNSAAASGQGPAGADFGQHLGHLVPGELLSRPVLRDFARYLAATFGTPPPGAAIAGVAVDGSNGEAGQSPTAKDPALGGDMEGADSLLGQAVQGGFGRVAAMALQLAEAGVLPPSEVCAPAAMLGAVRRGCGELVQVLLRHGFSAKVQDPKSLATPLLLAAGSTAGAAAFQALLAAGARISDRDANQQHVLHHAARAGDPSRILALVLGGQAQDVCSGSTKSRKGKAAGGRGTTRPAEDARQLLNSPDRWGRTALHWACNQGHREVVQLLLAHGADAGVRDAAGETAVQIAERMAQCRAQRVDGLRPSVFGGIATLLGGSGKTQRLKESL